MSTKEKQTVADWLVPSVSGRKIASRGHPSIVRLVQLWRIDATRELDLTRRSRTLARSDNSRLELENCLRHAPSDVVMVTTLQCILGVSSRWIVVLGVIWG